MSIGKDAAILSSLSPVTSGKPMKAPPPARAKAPTTPGLSEKMRQETSQALETMLKKSSFRTGLEDLVKCSAYMSSTGVPTARMVAPGSGLRTPTPSPPPSAAAPAGAVSLPPLSHPLVEAARGLPGRVMGPAKKMLGLGALGAGGALAFGMHQQNNEDREKNPLVYAPMQGSVMG